MKFTQKLKYCYRYQFRQSRWVHLVKNFWWLFLRLIQYTVFAPLAAICVVSYIPFHILRQLIEPLLFACTANDERLHRLKQLVDKNTNNTTNEC